MDLEQLIEICKGIKNSEGITIKQSVQSFQHWLEEFKAGNPKSFPSLNGIKTNKITDEEAFFILSYTGTFSNWINKEFRNGNNPSCNCKKEFIKQLDQSLSKIISFNDSITYRMDYPSDDKDGILNWFENKISYSFVVPYFLSTAKKDWKNSPIVWEIKTLPEKSFGKDISELTNNKNEEEILFERNAKFKILKVEKSINYVYLAELDSKSQVDFKLTGLYYLNI